MMLTECHGLMLAISQAAGSPLPRERIAIAKVRIQIQNATSYRALCRNLTPSQPQPVQRGRKNDLGNAGLFFLTEWHMRI